MKWSRYNVFVPMSGKGQVAVFNTLSRSLSKLDFKRDFDENLPPDVYADSKQLLRLESLGIVCDDALDETLVFKAEVRRRCHSNQDLALFVALSSACNFKCRYCYESYRDDGNAEKNMTMESWKEVYKFILSRIEADKIKNLLVVFYGGEPLLNYDVLLEASRQLHELKSRVRLNCSLVTNGSLLSPERSAELSQYIRQVQVCMDGLPQDHDIRRPYRDGRASFEDIMANMPACLSNFRRVTLSVGTDDESVDRLPGFLDMFASRVPSRENLAVVFRWIFSSQHEIEQGRNIALLDTDKVGKLLQLHRKAASLGFLVTKDFIEGPCMYPMSGGMVIDEKLNVYKCPGMIYQRACGAIRDGRIDGKNNNWYEGVTWAPSCADTCKYGPICYGGCRWKLNAHGGGCPKRQHEMNLAERVKMYMSLRYCGGVEENRCLK